MKVLPSSLESPEVATTLGNVLASLVDHRGRTPKKLGVDFTASGVPVISAKNIRDGRLVMDDVRFVSEDVFHRWMPERLEVGDVLLTSEAPLGEAAYLHDRADMCLGQRLFALRANPELLHSRYLYYLVRSADFRSRLDARATGTTAEGIRQSQLVKVEVELPALEYQVENADLLGALDDKIDVNRRISETLEEIARALFTSWFVDFDLVRGTATVPEGIRRLFPDRLVDSSIGPVPEGWEVAPLGEHVEVTRGLSYTGAGLADEGMPMHNLNSIREGGGYKETGIKHYVGEYRERDRVRPGDVIVANTDLTQNARVIGYPAIVPSSFGDDGLYSHHLYRLRPLESSPVTPHWFYLLLVARRIHQQIVGYTNGTTVNMLPKDGLTRPLIAVPPHALVERFDAIVAPMFDQQEALTAESKTLAALRDTLLPKLISGDLRLPHAS